MKQEGECGTIELKAVPSDADNADEADDACDDPEIVKPMIEYFYHFDYLPGIDVTPDAVTKAPDVNAAVDVNDWLSSLPKKKKGKKSSTAKETDTLFGVPDIYIIEHAKVFAIAVKYQIEGLRDLAVAKFREATKTQWSHEDFSHTIVLVYHTTADSVHQLRQIVADTLHERLDDLKKKGEIEVVVRSIPGLAYDLMKRSRDTHKTVICGAGHNTGGPQRRCQYCSEVFVPCSGCARNGYYVRCPKCER
jgi:hypothetical protein